MRTVSQAVDALRTASGSVGFPPAFAGEHKVPGWSDEGTRGSVAGMQAFAVVVVAPRAAGSAAVDSLGDGNEEISGWEALLPSAVETRLEAMGGSAVGLLVPSDVTALPSPLVLLFVFALIELGHCSRLFWLRMSLGSL